MHDDEALAECAAGRIIPCDRMPVFICVAPPYDYHVVLIIRRRL